MDTRIFSIFLVKLLKTMYIFDLTLDTYLSKRINESELWSELRQSKTNDNWSPDKYREDHESDEHWELRKQFMLRWKDEYPEGRLICLAKVFANMEFMGCRYPTEVMQEVSRLSQEIAKEYRKTKKTKLQRTFVSASTAAEDRAKGVKRAGGVIIDHPLAKVGKIDFVAQGEPGANISVQIESDNDNVEDKESAKNNNVKNIKGHSINATVDQHSNLVEKSTPYSKDSDTYHYELAQVHCLDARSFHEGMFHTSFGKLVLLVRPWSTRLYNIQVSCQVCGVSYQTTYEKNCFSMIINGVLVAQATGDSKADARSIVETMVWNRIKEEVITVLIKEQFMPHGDARISLNDVSGHKNEDAFGAPIESSVAMKMMKMMGWQGGGLGADAQGIAEPIKPKMQMVDRAGLGSSANVGQLRKAAFNLMRRFIESDTIDLDLVFSSDFSKEERAQLHKCAQKMNLASRSYGDVDRFLVVKKKIDPFSLARAVIDKGGVTNKYHVYIPAKLGKMRR
ncbi:hypothetical protein ACJJTC_005733 [Scirpophaga incertulas]